MGARNATASLKSRGLWRHPTIHALLDATGQRHTNFQLARRLEVARTIYHVDNRTLFVDLPDVDSAANSDSDVAYDVEDGVDAFMRF